MLEDAGTLDRDGLSTGIMTRSFPFGILVVPEGLNMG
jgi:hypothetical protein